MKFATARRGARRGFSCETDTMELALDAAKVQGEVILSLDLIGHNGLQISFSAEQWQVFLTHANQLEST